jgi:hypothetical protein
VNEFDSPIVRPAAVAQATGPQAPASVTKRSLSRMRKRAAFLLTAHFLDAAASGAGEGSPAASTISVLGSSTTASSAAWPTLTELEIAPSAESAASAS